MFPLPPLQGGSSPNPLQVWDALDAHGTSSLQWFGFRLQCQHMTLLLLVARGVDFSVDAVGPGFGFPVRGGWALGLPAPGS